jgi:hypothetical protein
MASELLTIAPLSHVLEEFGAPNAQRDQCIVPRNIFRQWVEQHETEVMLVEIIQGDVKVTLCVDGPHALEEETIYVPDRFMTSLEEGKYVEVRLLTALPPLATKITLQPIDSEVYHCDISLAVSEMLAQWHVLEMNTILSVPLPELGGYVADVIVKATEPAPVVLLRGEVPMELEEPLIHVPEFQKPQPVQQLGVPQTTAPQTTAQPTTVPPPSPSTSPSPMGMIDPLAQIFGQQQTTQGFVAFSGRGYKLGRGN